MTTQRRGQKTVERALDAALACFTEQGLHAATIQELSARSGVSVGSLYHHFGSRQGVVFALYRRSLASMLATITAAVVRHRDAQRGVRALVRSYLAFAEAHPDETRLIYAAAHSDLTASHRAELDALAAELVAPLARWLAPRIEDGSIAPLPPALLEVALIGPPAEAARRILTGTPGLSFQEAAAVLPGLVWRSVASQRGAKRLSCEDEPPPRGRAELPGLRPALALRPA